MFRLHQTTRRRLLLALFAATCLAPTLLVLARGSWRNSPWYRSSEAERLGRRLGLLATLDAVEHPWPGVVCYRGLELADPETGRPILRCDRIELVEQAVAGSQRGATQLVATAAKIEVEVGQTAEIAALLDRLLACRMGDTGGQVRLEIAELTLADGRTALGSLAQVSARAVSRAEGSLVELRFQTPGDASGEPAVVQIVRDRRGARPRTWFEVSTGGAPLPCAVLAHGLPPFAWCGPGGQFAGNLKAAQTDEGWAGQLRGRFLQVDLERLVSGRFPHRLTGTATIAVADARFQAGRIVSVQGTIEAGPGTVSNSLLAACEHHLGCPAAGDATASGSSLPYENLALYVELDSQGLRLSGRCPHAEGGAVLVDRYGRLLGEPDHQPQPVAALLAALVPGSAVQVPATAQTDWLMRYLPLPEVGPLAARPPTDP